MKPTSAKIVTALSRLDKRIESALRGANQAFGPIADAGGFRGLHITAEEIARVLAAPPAESVLWRGDRTPRSELDSFRLPGLDFGLTGFDEDILLVALAPEIDLRYERLYAYLQDDVTRKRPTVDLALNLLCSSAAEKLVQRSRFLASGPLISHGLIRLIGDPSQTQPPLLAHFLKIDDQILNAWLGEESLPSRLASFCEFVEGAAEARMTAAEVRLAALLKDAVAEKRGLVVELGTRLEPENRRIAANVASRAGVRLLAANLDKAPEGRGELDDLPRLLVREAQLRGAILYLKPGTLLTSMLDFAEKEGVVAIVHGRSEVARTRSIPVVFPGLEFPARVESWFAALHAEGIAIDAPGIDMLASRLDLAPTQIEEAVRSSRSYSTLRNEPKSPPTVSDLFTAARAQSGQDLAAMARRIQPVHRWEQLVVPEDVLAQLKEICDRVAMRQRVLKDWGFDARLTYGKGVSALFAGPSGTGKTMAAEIIAAELQLDLYRIDLAGIVSKYIGETEKNLDRVFIAAANANAVLFFDEADALFGKRSEVRDSHDRYANIEVSYLLQKMEEFEGIAILATNLRQNLDESFIRRLTFSVHFPFPDEASRRAIWYGIWPAETPIENNIDFSLLAQRFRLSGGNIRNAALAAAFLAAHEGVPVSTAHLLHAVRREYQKMGKALGPDELAMGKGPSS